MERDRCLHIIHSRRVGRKLELGENGIDHVAFALHQVSEKNFVLDQLRSFLCEIGLTGRKQLLKALPRLGPIFFQKRDLRQIEAGIPKLRIDPCRLSEGSVGLIVVTLPHEDYAPKVLRRREIGLARINRVELL